MYNYTYTPVTVKVVCTILYSPETSLQWAATHLTLNSLNDRQFLIGAILNLEGGVQILNRNTLSYVFIK